MPRVAVNGTSLEYVEQGEGQPILFVHGGSGDLRTWKEVLPAFGADYRAIAVSCRGYQPNQPLRDDEPLPLDAHVADLVGFVRALELAPVHLVGHSSPGGFGSLLFATREPALLRSLVLIEPPAFPLLGVNIPPKPPQILRLLVRHPRIAAGFLKFGAKAVRPAMKAFERGDDEQGLRLFVAGNLGPAALAEIPPALLHARFQQGLENIRPLKAQLKAGFPPISADEVRKISVPTLLVAGERSNAVLRGVTDRLAELLPNVAMLDIPNASHNMFDTDPETFNRGVMAFLETH